MNVTSVHRLPPGTVTGRMNTPATVLTPSLPPPLDLEGLLHAAQIDRRKIQQTTSESDIRTAQGKRDAQTREARAVAERADAEARDAADKAQGAAFWKKCAAYAGVVASVAATVATCGSAAPLAVVAVGVALSLSSPYIGKGVEKVTGSEDAGRWTTVGCAIAGAVVQTIGSGGTASAGTVATLARGTQALAAGTAGAASMAEGYRTMESKNHESDSEHLRADALQMRSAAKRTQGELDEVIEQLKGLEASIRRALDAVGGVGRELDAGRQRVAMHLARSY